MILIIITLSFQPTETITAMYVCLCKGVTDTEIRAAIEDGANSLKKVRNALGVASQCGKCGILTREILRETLSDNVQEEALFYALS